MAKATHGPTIQTQTGDEAEEQKLHRTVDAAGAAAGEETGLSMRGNRHGSDYLEPKKLNYSRPTLYSILPEIRLPHPLRRRQGSQRGRGSDEIGAGAGDRLAAAVIYCSKGKGSDKNEVSPCRLRLGARTEHKLA